MNKEFYEDARKMAESCSKERLVELYLAEVQTCCELEKALELACEMLCGLSVWEEKEEFDKAIKDICEYFTTKAKEIQGE